MLEPEDRAAWEDAYRNSQLQTAAESTERAGGWYSTACLVAVGLLVLWALHAWSPVQ